MNGVLFTAYSYRVAVSMCNINISPIPAAKFHTSTQVPHFQGPHFYSQFHSHAVPFRLCLLHFPPAAGSYPAAPGVGPLGKGPGAVPGRGPGAAEHQRRVSNLERSRDVLFGILRDASALLRNISQAGQAAMEVVTMYVLSKVCVCPVREKV